MAAAVERSAPHRCLVGRIGAALFGAAAVAVLWARVFALYLPLDSAVNRLYAAIYLAAACWGWGIVACLRAASGWRAWGWCLGLGAAGWWLGAWQP